MRTNVSRSVLYVGGIWLVAMAGLVLSGNTANAASYQCTNVQLIYARDSGQSLQSREFTNLTSDIESRVTPALSYQAYELGSAKDATPRYSAADKPRLTNDDLRESLSASTVYAYTTSVADGVSELRSYVSGYLAACGSGRVVLAGMGQGAQVVSEAIARFSEPERQRIAYVGLLGDPALFLPEGEGEEVACRGEGMSAYRRGVADCHTARGALGARDPFVPTDIASRTGLWCAVGDFWCGATTNPNSRDNRDAYLNAISQIAREAVTNVQVAHPDVRLKTQPVIATTQNATPRGAKQARTLGATMAALKLNSYYAKPGQEITFDASDSYTDKGELKVFEWDFDSDGTIDQVTPMPVTTHAYEKEFDGNAQVVVRASHGASADTSARVRIGPPRLPHVTPAPQSARVTSDGDANSVRATITWQADGVATTGWMLALNGVPLGRVAGDARQVVVTDVNPAELANFAIIPLNTDGELGDAAQVVLGAPEETPPSTQPAAPEAPAKTVAQSHSPVTASRHIDPIVSTAPTVDLIQNDPIFRQINPAATQMVASITAPHRDSPGVAKTAVSNAPLAAGLVAVFVSLISAAVYVRRHLRMR